MEPPIEVPVARLDPRWLTPASKDRILAQWQSRLAEPRPAGDLSGRGWPDPEIVPLCNGLNRLPGVCTLQSCSGHGGPGHLWLWLDHETSGEFDRWGHVLARMAGIEAVSRKWSSWGQEITAIDFDSRFEDAYNSVEVFFLALVGHVRQSPARSLARHSLSSSPLAGRRPDATC